MSASAQVHWSWQNVQSGQLYTAMPNLSEPQQNLSCWSLYYWLQACQEVLEVNLATILVIIVLFMYIVTL